MAWYKQFTESICVAGWALFCNSRARPASKVLEGLNLSIVPATGLDSETTSRFLKGTFEARTSKSKLFSQFSVFRFGVRRKSAFFAVLGGRPYRCVRFLSLQAPQSFHSEQISHVENMCKCCGMCRLTGSRAATYVCKVSRTAGFALVAGPSRTEGAPLRRKAIRSLTTRLNVPVVRERIRALV